MQIILQENVEKVGTRGQIVEVADGFARNFLLPRKLAIEASQGNMKRLEQIRATLAKREASERGLAEQQAAAMSAVTISLTRKSGDGDHLFGSVTAADIAEALEAQGHKVEKRKVQLAEPIKILGEYQVPIKLHPEVSVSVKVAVSKE
ncbi:MAG: 50S ribosomal protein L9 [Acidobacteria bacterium]|nr:50S ribosomal protein L9 [Acidobacteriota bacterium]